MANYASAVIDIALAEVGYLEKKSNSNLDSKTANAGSANYTKYGRDMHKIYPSVMDFPAAWCDAFVDWCFQKAYGVSNAKGLIGGDFNDYTPSSANLYKNKNAWGNEPKIGAQIFFKNSTRICHTGLVYDFDEKYVYTVEGNTSGASGVISNGGGVCKKKYTRTNSRIAGYGYPKYDTEPMKVATNTVTNTNKDEKTIWDFLYGKFNNAYAVAGLMGNLYAESVLKPTNVQNSYERKLGFTDEVYTAAVDGGKYDNFVRDSAGYGLAQWTYWSRKENLLKYAQSKGVSIGDLTMQLEFLYKELSVTYKGIMTPLKSATSVREASDIILTKFEKPADQSEKVKVKRAEYGQKYYDKYAKKTSTSTKTPSKTNTKVTNKVDAAQKKDKTLAGTYKVTASSLHIRTGAGTTKKSLGTLKNGTEVKNYGYYTVASNNVKWLYVQTDEGVVGFCSSRYLKKC